jgi:hypothetical protein
VLTGKKATERDIDVSFNFYKKMDHQDVWTKKNPIGKEEELNANN